MSPNTLFQLHLRRSSVVLVTKAKYSSDNLNGMRDAQSVATCYKIQPSVLAVPLDTFSHCSVRSLPAVWQHSPL